jgi:hypothetical protein
MTYAEHLIVTGTLVAKATLMAIIYFLSQLI